MKRNRTIDVFRAVAILSVLIYHFYVLCNYPYANRPFINRMIGTGGELGVTLFFIISGFGIYSSLESMERKGNLGYFEFLKKRFFRILPQYYLGLGVLLLITSNAQYLNKRGLFDILTHALFIHNWFPSTHGSINGVLWSLGTIFQFYLLSYLLYKILKKINGIWIYVLSVCIVVSLKIIIYHWILPYTSADASAYFIYGRQVFTALDNFIAGMLLSKLLMQRKQCKKVLMLCLSAGMLILCGLWIWSLQIKSPYADDWYGYIWHSVFAFLLMILMYAICNIGIQYHGFFFRLVFFVSKYQYGTYIWHFVIASTLISASTFFNKLSGNSFILYTIAVLAVCITAGFFSTVTLEGVDYKKLFSNLKRDLLQD